MIKNYKFKVYKGQYQLDWNDTNNFVRLILSEIIEYKSCIFDFIQQYYRWFMKGEEITKFPKVVISNDNN